MGAEIVVLIIVAVLSGASGVVSIATCFHVTRRLEDNENHDTGIDISNEMTTTYTQDEEHHTRTQTTTKTQHVRINSTDATTRLESYESTETCRKNEVANTLASAATGGMKLLEGPATIAETGAKAISHIVKHQREKEATYETRLAGIREVQEIDSPNPQKLLLPDCPHHNHALEKDQTTNPQDEGAIPNLTQLAQLMAESSLSDLSEG